MADLTDHADEILARVAAGQSATQIARECHVCRKTVYAVCRRAGVDGPKNGMMTPDYEPTPEEIEAAKAELKAKHLVAKIYEGNEAWHNTAPGIRQINTHRHNGNTFFRE